jgi:dipeptidyl aminopeptidase/acylaminoacyl peptidase
MWGLGAAVVAIVILGQPMESRAELPPLIPREVLFGNPEKVSPQISPDGKRLAWIAPNDKGVLQVWVRTIGQTDDKVITDDPKRGIRQFLWAPNSEQVLYVQDKDGDENWHLYGVTLASGKIVDFTPFENVQARPVALELEIPDEVLIALNRRTPQLHDVYKLNLKSGELKLVYENPGDVVGFEADQHLVVRAVQAMKPDGGVVIRVRDDAEGSLRPWIEAGPEDSLTLGLIGFTADGKGLYLTSGIGRDKAAIFRKDVATGEETLIAESDVVDAGGVMMHPTKRVIEAVAFEPGRRTWQVVDSSVAEDLAGIAKLHDGDFGVTGRDKADRHWLVGFTSDRGPVAYYAWDRELKKGTFLFVHQPKLEGLKLAEMRPVEIPTRDGLKMHGYLTLPVGVEPKNLPMVLVVHGGPWARDTWGYDSEAQWLANRGYAVLQVNFRGSTGYGKAFLNAGDRQWGRAMHNDLLDAKAWAVKEGYANPEKVAVFGGSYGGYAALASVTFTPREFACAVDIVGPSNIATLIRSIPPYWKPMRAIFDQRVGNIDDPKDEELIRSASPLFKADQIVRPLLIGQGANDPRVKQAESEQIVEAIAKSGGKATYVLYSDEGHGFARPENRIDFNARAEAFLAQHLGGRVEPIEGEKIRGSTAVVREVGKK